MKTYHYNDSVFINCPFDEVYSEIFRAIIFCVYRCGFIPVCALIDDNALKSRMEKIFKIIEDCRYGVHDISRIELNQNKMPRFNMPFELGLFYGAWYYGNKRQKNKSALIFERQRYQYQEYISDISGIDTKAHEDDPKIVIRNIRDWLFTASRRKTILSTYKIIQEYNTFKLSISKLLEILNYETIEEVSFNDYCQLVEEVIRSKIIV